MESEPKLTIPEMLAKLDLMYKKQNQIEIQVALLYKEYEQLGDDINMAQNIIMHQSNKKTRSDEIKSIFS